MAVFRGRGNANRVRKGKATFTSAERRGGEDKGAGRLGVFLLNTVTNKKKKRKGSD